jgi:8-oxo-dGTP pyrophosphatase MutT (NUDIX family)
VLGHSARHTCNTILTELGVPVDVRIQILGHASNAVNEDVYTHTSDVRVAEAMAADGPSARLEAAVRETYEERTLDGAVHFYEGPCDHAEAVPVESVASEVVAHLCLCCDAQLPASWR